ncbi:MAG: GspH/FimT family pseudopilin [Halioglobus sp.]|nr:GspH/FimT family pseudopilin [Halioglobus sp.]
MDLTVSATFFGGRRRAGGFSLLEMLVTLMVIVIFTSLVSLNVGSGDAEIRLESQVRQLADTAEYALDEAQFTGWDYGLVITREEEEGEFVYAWSWRERAVDGWRAPLSGKEIFAEQRLPPAVAVELEIEDSPYEEADPREPEEERGPQIVFYASGETTPGTIDVRRRQDDELLWRIEWDLLGRFEVLRGGIPREEEDAI